MQPEVGAVLEGKVSGVTKFGAFVNLPGDKSGLVHISEIANTFVSDVAQYVSVGQTVKVKVIGINGDKINLSIKRAEESKEAPRRRAPQQLTEQQSRPPKQPQQPSGQVAAPTEDQAFEGFRQPYCGQSHVCRPRPFPKKKVTNQPHLRLIFLV